MKLSIVTTLYQSSSYIEEFYQRISTVAKSLCTDFEILFVNDGSPDNSVDTVLFLREKDERVKLIDLSRNFGHHRAMMTGLQYAKGDRIFLIDCDLEEEPELLTQFWREFEANTDVDVVYGVQEKRKGEISERLFGSLFYKVFNYLSEVPIPENFLTVRLMSKRYVNELSKYDERVMQFSILTELAGFRKKEVMVEKGDKGTSTYGLKLKLSHVVDAVTSTSIKPLVWIFRLGLIVSFFSILYVAKIILFTFLNNTGVDGWASLIVSIWLIGGILMSSVGIVGIYISKIFVEVKKRPLISIKNKYLD